MKNKIFISIELNLNILEKSKRRLNFLINKLYLKSTFDQ
jgi:hypothetical protein